MSEPKVKLAHRLEAAVVWLVIKLLRPFTPQTASRIGSTLAGCIGLFIPTSKVADMNLRLAMPELGAAARKKIVKQCWQSLGATAAELVRIGEIPEIPLGAAGPGYTVLGWEENAAPALAEGGPFILITGHIGNWEILPQAAFARGLDIGFMYRAASNPLVDQMILRLRETNFKRPVKMFAKGSGGARGAYAHMRKGGQLGLLVDQKLDTGLSIPLFGHNAMTMDAMGSLALKFRCPIIPCHVERIAPARFHITCEPPLSLPNTGNKQTDMINLTTTMNQTLERWIRTNPGAWLWLHRRWPKGTQPVA